MVLQQHALKCSMTLTTWSDLEKTEKMVDEPHQDQSEKCCTANKNTLADQVTKDALES